MSTNSVASEAREVLLQLIENINQLTYDEYTCKLDILSESTIGEHTRHIIEFFQQLSTGYESAIVDYNNRKRNLEIQQNVDYAIECIATIISHLERENKSLLLGPLNDKMTTLIDSNYLRELVYNIEHCIHHQAIIKIGLVSVGKLISKDNFGVSKSTLIYRSKNVHG